MERPLLSQGKTFSLRRSSFWSVFGRCIPRALFLSLTLTSINQIAAASELGQVSAMARAEANFGEEEGALPSLGQLQMRLSVEPSSIRQGEIFWILAEVVPPKSCLISWRGEGPDYPSSTLHLELPTSMRLLYTLWPRPQVIKIGSELHIGYTKRAYVLMQVVSSEASRLERQSALLSAEFSLVSSEGVRSRHRLHRRVFLPRPILPGQVPPPIDLVSQSLFAHARAQRPLPLPLSRYQINWSTHQPIITLWGLFDAQAPLITSDDIPSRARAPNSFDPFVPAQESPSPSFGLFGKSDLRYSRSDPSTLPSQGFEESGSRTATWYLILARTQTMAQRAPFSNEGVALESWSSARERALWSEAMADAKGSLPPDPRSLPHLAKLPGNLPYWIAPLQHERSSSGRLDRFYLPPEKKEELIALSPQTLYLVAPDGEQVYALEIGGSPNAMVGEAPKAKRSWSGLFTSTKKWWKMVMQFLAQT